MGKGRTRRMMELLSRNARQTQEIAAAVAARLKPGDVVALFGGLGAGKTAFVSGLAQGLGIHCAVSSPTFALVNHYPGEIPLYHFDMYRIKSWEDLYSIGFFDYLDMSAILAIEWSENIENALPQGHYRVEITTEQDAETRKIRIFGVDALDIPGA